MSPARSVRAGRRTVAIHRPGKVLFPRDGDGREYTKADLVAYHRSVARFMRSATSGSRPV